MRVYDASSGALLATYQPPGVGLLNDVAVTRDAVYVTDSGFPQLVVIPLPQDGSLPPASAATILPLGGDMIQTPGFNLNGIVAEDGFLLVAQSSTGKLFRVDPATGVAPSSTSAESTSATRTGSSCSDTRSTSSALPRPGHRRLAQSGPHPRRRARRPDRPSLDIPSTATVAAGRLWAVNLRYTTPPEPTTPYWITQLPLRP